MKHIHETRHDYEWTEKWTVRYSALKLLRALDTTAGGYMGKGRTDTADITEGRVKTHAAGPAT